MQAGSWAEAGTDGPGLVGAGAPSALDRIKT